MYSYTDFRDDIEAKVQDSGNTYYTAALLDKFIVQAFRDSARWVPHIVFVAFEIESRRGSATSTSSGNLVDASNSQFSSSDVGKRVYNQYDKTWATITGYTSATTVTLSKDIFTSGESYRIFNADCFSEKQVNINSVTAVEDYIGVARVEYPVGTPRNFTLSGANNDILEVLYDYPMPDSFQANSDITVHVYFKKRHKLSQLTDFAGAVNLGAGYSAGDTSMVLDSLQASGTIEEGQEFTLPYSSWVYTVTSAATIATNAATITFYPGLEIDVSDDTVVTFRKSTLTPALEMILPDYVAGLTSVSLSQTPLQQILACVSTISTVSTAIGNLTARITQAVTDIGSGRTEAAKMPALVSAATAVIATASADIDTANSNLDTASSLLNVVTAGRGLTDYVNYAQGYFGTAKGYFDEALANIQQASGDANTATAYYNAARTELAAGTTYLSQANSYLNNIRAQLQVANNGALEAWGRRKIQDAKDALNRLVGTRTTQVYSRG